VVTPGDRDDIILAVSLAAINGVPLAGLLLTSDSKPDPRMACAAAPGRPAGAVGQSTGSYDTANQLNSLNKEIGGRPRARRVHHRFRRQPPRCRWLHQRCGTPREMRLSPAVFRYQLIQRAQQATSASSCPKAASR
jgi:phosphate acetyltransferase